MPTQHPFLQDALKEQLGLKLEPKMRSHALWCTRAFARISAR
jgi:hypothetical protein